MGLILEGNKPGGTSLYKPYMHLSPQKEGFLRRLGLKTGIDFAHFGLKSDMGLVGNYGSV